MNLQKESAEYHAISSPPKSPPLDSEGGPSPKTPRSPSKDYFQPLVPSPLVEKIYLFYGITILLAWNSVLSTLSFF